MLQFRGKQQYRHRIDRQGETREREREDEDYLGYETSREEGGLEKSQKQLSKLILHFYSA